MVHVTRKDMERAFRQHKEVFQSPGKADLNNTRRMVLFYAVECGLKAYFMKIKDIRSTNPRSHSKQNALDFNHDLNGLIAVLNITPTVPCAQAMDNNQIESAELHEAWRYGKELEKQKETKCVESLTRILNTLEEKLYGGHR
ncbi:MAG: hypothetical protein MUF15_00480 [Acidobacteria bacterium]|jgi:hypothetical protein|nr:hypothetical protein [Acidobacteriota bacterium]